VYSSLSVAKEPNAMDFSISFGTNAALGQIREELARRENGVTSRPKELAKKEDTPGQV